MAKYLFCFRVGNPRCTAGMDNQWPARFIKYEKKILFVSIDYFGMYTHGGAFIIDNVIATKTIILI